MSGHGAHIDPPTRGSRFLLQCLPSSSPFPRPSARPLRRTRSRSTSSPRTCGPSSRKTIRQTTIRTAAEEMEAQFGAKAPEAVKQVEAWKKTAAADSSEPETGEGRKELMARARKEQAKRDRAMAAYHHYEVASAAVQIAIVLASAEIITGVIALLWFLRTAWA